MIESTSCSVAGAYHLHVDYDDEYSWQSAKLMIGLDISPIEKILEGERSNENLLGDFLTLEFDSFVFETSDDIPPNDVVWEGLDSSSYEHEVDYELFLFDLLENNKALQ